MEIVIAVLGSGALSAVISGVFGLLQTRRKRNDGVTAGTEGGPAPFVCGMDTEQGGHCSFGGKAYLCSLAMPACVRGPGTPGLWQWTEVTE